MSESENNSQAPGGPADGPPQQGAPTDRSTPSRRGRRAVVIGAVSLLVLGGVGAGAYFPVRAHLDRPTAEDHVRAAVRSATDALQDGDIGRLRSAFCAEYSEQLAQFSPGQFAALTRLDNSKNGRYTIDAFDTVEVSGDRARATVSGHVDRGDIGVQHTSFALTRINDDWKLCKWPEDDPATKARQEQAAAEQAVRDVVTKFYDAVADRDRERLVALSDGPVAQSIAGASPDQFARTLRSWGTLESVDEVVIRSDSAKVTVTGKDRDGRYVAELTLQRIFGEWKLSDSAEISR
ncbi:Rv0361 family membrane protein [Nocardia sp. CA-119907]|uniref:Rv0361 family membrane protein n=1 Tax=Nocardia sp. CA-119907 TaxID=3239973 RepID=UPI003D984DEC